MVKVTGPNTLTYTQTMGTAATARGNPLHPERNDRRDAGRRFVPSATGNLAAPASLTFKYSNGGVQATKTFTFDQKTYLLHAYVAVTRAAAPVQAMLSWPGGFGDQNDDPRGSGYTNAQFDSDRNGSAEHLAPKKITDGETLNGPFDWAGVGDPFFAAVFLPESPATATIATLHGDTRCLQGDQARGDVRLRLGAHEGAWTCPSWALPWAMPAARSRPASSSAQRQSMY